LENRLGNVEFDLNVGEVGKGDDFSAGHPQP
jgi:hypothetical protein